MGGLRAEDMTGTAPHIAIVNPFGIGDVLCSTPLIAAVRRAHPTARLLYVCNARAQDVLAANPHLDRIVVFEKDEYRALWQRSPWQAARRFAALVNSLRRERLDLVIDCSLGDRYSAVFALLGVRRRVGFDYRGRGRFQTHRLPVTGFDEKHVAEYYLDLLRLIGLAPGPGAYEFPLTEHEMAWAAEWRKRSTVAGRPYLVVLPAGGASWGEQAVNRWWPAERFAQVAERLAARHHLAVVLAGHGERELALCQAVRRAMTSTPVNVAGALSLRQFAAVLGGAALALSNDGGPMHVLVSQRCPSVSIFGPVDPQVYGPYPADARHAVITRALPCRPCYKRFQMPPCPIDLDCLKGLEVDTVLQAAEAQLARFPVTLN